MADAYRITASRALSLLVPPLATMGLIFFLSAQSDLGPTHGLWELVGRKLAHATEYAALTLCWWRALRGLFPRRASVATLASTITISLAYAASDEYHQTFVAGRHGHATDVLIDSIGIAIAAVLVTRAYARRRRLGPSRPSAA